MVPFLVAAAIALTCQVAVVVAVIAGRAPAASTRRSARWVEIGWVLLPTAVLIAVLFATWSRLADPVAVLPVPGVPA